MSATEGLRHEHKIILKVMEAARREAQGIAGTGRRGRRHVGGGKPAPAP